MPKLKASWRTSVLGTGGLIYLVIDILAKLSDDNPHTNPDWNIAVPALLAALSGIFARDETVSDQKAGVRPEPDTSTASREA